MKKERQFLYDLYRRRVKNLPFLHLFQQNKELRKELFQQYLKTDLKPDYDLFLRSHYSEKDLKEGFMEVRERIPLSRVGMASFVPQTDFETSLHNLKREFHNLSAQDQLPDKFKTHSIEKTEVIKRLKDLQTLINDFNLYVIRNKVIQIKDYAEAFATNIKNVLPKLGNNLLSKLILEDFIEKQQFSEERIDFLIENKIDAENAKRNYRQLIMYTNNIIHDYLKGLKIENQTLLKTPRIKALFNFIEYLHSNIDNFNQYNGLIIELEQLDEKRNELKPRNNYKDKQQYDIVQAELESKFKTLQDNTANLIKAKARELNVCNFDSEPNYNFNGVETEIRQLKDNFSTKDLPEIFKHKRQYLEYRSRTHKTFLSLQFFFEELDEIAKSLFDYFKDTEQNEFEAFENKVIKVNSIAEAVKGFKQGQTKFTLPNSFLLNSSHIQQPHNEALPPQRETTNFEFETLSNLITHQKGAEIVENIKIQYKNIKGKRLKLLLMAFQELGLLPKERVAQKFYECCKKEFKWNIASYNAMNGYRYNDHTDNKEFSDMKQYLETLIKTN